MFRRNKVETVGTISEFMKRDRDPIIKGHILDEIEKKQVFNLGLAGGVALPFVQYSTVAAQSNTAAIPTAALDSGVMYEKMLHAFDPLIGLVQALAYPVAMVVVLGGALFVMIGNREKGFTMMQGAGLGYVLVQMTPMVLNILVDAMKSAV